MTDEIWERYLDQQLDEVFGREQPGAQVGFHPGPRAAATRTDRARRTAPLAAGILGVAVTIGALVLADPGDPDPVPGQGREVGEPVEVHSAEELAKVPATTSNLCAIGLHDGDLAGIARLAGLRRLELRAKSARVAELTGAALARVARLRQLEEVHLVYQRGITDLTPLGALPRLRTLSLHGSGADDRTLAALPGFPALRALDIGECPGVTEAGIAHVVRCRELRSLKMRCMAWLDEASLASLGRLRNLRVLDLSSVDGRQKWYHGEPRPGGSATGVTGDVMRAFAALEQLEVLNLAHDAGVTDDGLAALTGLGALRELDLRYLPNISDRGLAALPTGIEELVLQGTSVEGTVLGRFTRLRHLHLGTCRSLLPAAIDGLVAGKSSKSLEILVIGGCQRLSSKHLAQVAGLPALRCLGLNFLKWLEDGDLAALAPMRGRLEELWIGFNRQLTAECLAHLRGFEKLRYLLVEDTGIARAAIDDLRRRQPGLRIEVGDAAGTAGERVQEVNGVQLEEVRARKLGGERRK